MKDSFFGRKRLATLEENICKRHSDKELLPKMYRELLKLKKGNERFN